ncbi:Very-long-chain enoyl-CoA reductase-like [Oopsacas minuta]|uniref:very-long-chain enoyl-CoA reductase n=1 Tax=Oopsacas minuta TaxID=111878 RepID=A0AAV7K264_9METZ|nr:Very-long-chain enoyl-CoA reductase-like [Oopsacas minuta]
MQLKIAHQRAPEKVICTLTGLESDSTILNVKNLYAIQKPKYYVSRQQFKFDPKEKALSDNKTLAELNITDNDTLYFKDLGPQIGWGIVFFWEYFGPLCIYPLFFLFPQYIYGTPIPKHDCVVELAAGCWIFHYFKRILETLFIHKFSHGTMPIMNLFKNSSYYWGFAAFIAYYVNHPQYTPPNFGEAQVYTGLAIFVFCELGNFSIHVALSNLRASGTTERRIPIPTLNPFTWLFGLVSCPNYSYEVAAWFGFSLMTQCLPALFFTLAGFLQMAIWAIGKHKNYRREFKDYPRGRYAIIPFLV